MPRLSLSAMGFVFFLSLMVPNLSFAANRTFCFTGFRFDDGRTNCANESTDPGARRGCVAGDNYMIGAWFDIYDYDSDGTDEKIQRFQVTQAGNQCYTFPWEGESYQEGEAFPDLYVKFVNVVQSTNGGNTVTALDQNGGTFSPTSWRTTARINNCMGTCVSPTIHILSVNSSAYVGSRMTMLDTAQHTLEVYSSILTSDVKYWVEPCDGSSVPCPGTFTDSRILVKSGQDRGNNGRTPAHELGHVLQEQLFGQDYLRDVCGGSHFIDGWELDSCATTEGWANYVAAVSWWDPGNTASIPKIGGGYSIEEACQYESGTYGNGTNISCTVFDNGGYELQVAKSFWDLDDANNESGECGSTANDQYNAGTIFIANGWAEFPDGTADRKDYENNDNGVNVWDYYYNNNSRFSNASNLKNTLVYHNCVGTQVEN